MDNLTHSLVGALLGQMGLKRKTGLAMPTLIIAANIPDIDAVAVLLGGHQHLALRRGLTHGPIAMVLLPLVLWGAMLWFDRWQERRGKRPDKRLPVHKGWLLGLAYLGCLSHPLFDWFNSYGIRLLEPFSSQWFYGDTLFIIDIWIWAALIVGIWLSLRRERQNFKNVRRPAVISCLAVLVYISVNAGISNSAVSSTLEEIRKRTGQQYIEQIVANPVPIAFWQREVLFGSTNNYYRTEYSAFAARPVKVDVPQIEIGKHLPNIIDIEKLAVKNSDLAAFLFWSRMPYDGITEQNGKREAIVRDARFNNPLAQERFTVRMKLQGYEGSNDPSSLATCCASLDEAK
jgi:inner membrane protein